MNFLPLLWQVPAVFTAVPMVARLWPVKLAPRAIPLFYFIVALVVMALPGRVDLALAAAGLVSILHQHVGVKLSAEEPPDMKEVANNLALAWDYIAPHLPVSYWPLTWPPKRQALSVDDTPEDGNPEHEDYQEPPVAPEGKIPQRIAHL